MGVRASREAPRQRVGLLELRDWVTEQVEERYNQGLVDVLAALVSAFRPSKDFQAAKPHLDAIVHTIEAYGKEFPSSLDQSSVSSMVKGLHEVLATVSKSGKSLSDLYLKSSGEKIGQLMDILQMFKSELGVAVKEAEAVCEEHKLVLKEMFRIKMRVLEGWDVALDEFQMLRETSKIRVDYEQTLQRYNHCKEETLESFEDSMYDESLLLKEHTSELTAKMDTMLAPFIRISHNIKGKGKIGGPSLTDDELALIRKYTIVLSEPDLYPRIEANGSSLEDFLEALFLMGIAGGVGMHESAAKQSGFSKKSQIILAQALDNFNADELRSCYTKWRELHLRREAIGKDERFVEKDMRVQRGSAMWLEAAKEMDRISKEWQCQEELGIAVELEMPEEVLVEYEQEVKDR